jgi:dTDP-4-amino-4,6-dideoxygalactose transaminase
VFHVYAVRCDERDALMAHLQADDIGCAVHYPMPIHLQPAYRGLGYREGDFPHAEAAARTMVSLPMYAELTLEQVRRVGDSIAEWQHNNADQAHSRSQIGGASLASAGGGIHG